MPITEVPDSSKLFHDDVFDRDNESIATEWKRIGELYPEGANQPLLPDTFSREQFAQGNHYECFMLSTLATLVHYPDVIRNCFVTKKVRQDGRYTFQFFRGKEWVKVEIDDRIPLDSEVDEEEILYCQSPTGHWWPLLLEKAYAKFYTAYDHTEGCTLQETYHDLTGNPVLNIPMDSKLAKAAGADVTEGAYWLSLSQKISSGHFVASVLTKDMDLENMGLQREQQYGVIDIFSLTGTSAVSDVVIQLYNPFEDSQYVYCGPLNSKDTTWTPKLRAKYDVDDPRMIFLPLNTFLKIMNSVQLCYMDEVERDATYFSDEWKGDTAGGNPISVTWRKNPLYYVHNSGSTPADVVAMIKQDDQRRFTSPDEFTKYLQCGMVMVRYTYANPIATFWVTGNNHKPVYKSLFLNSREVACAMTIPPNSLCYLVPSCMLKGAEGQFDLALYRMKGVDYSDLTIKKLSIPGMNWANPATKSVELRQKEKDRVDFYVDEETDIHVLMHQEKPYITKTGGDAMTEDYMGMYLYDDTDHKIGGVHAATNFREVSVIHHLPRSGRFALSVTCPRAKGDVPAYVTIVGSPGSNVRIVDPPEDATMFDDDDEQIDEGDDAELAVNPIDYFPIVLEDPPNTEVPDSNSPFEDKRFMIDNRNVTKDPWVHIGDLYPEGKNKPLLPDQLSADQFEQGEHYECCCLSAFAALVDNHPEVIENCFVTKKPRKDGRYTFQFHRYGQWVKVEIDDRIPQVDGNTLYCRSPTHHWWPLLLEKAYAKFYTLYQNLEGITMQEVFHDFSGRPVLSIPTDPELASAALYDIENPQFWLDLNRDLNQTAIAGLTKLDAAEQLGMQDDQSYTVLGFVPMKNSSNLQLRDILVKIYNPFEEARYTGPMNRSDPSWPADMRQICNPDDKNLIYMPVDTFCDVFLNMQQAFIKGPLEPCWHFRSEWGEGTNGGNPTLVTWRENPLYVIRNIDEDPLQIIAMIRQPDQRHLLHRQTNSELNYIQCGLILAESTTADRIPTYLVTGNNHRTIHKGLFLNSREVANLITVPADSLCYLVPSAMLRDKGKFILSYWYLRSGDDRKMSAERLKVDVARHLPAIDRVELRNKEKDRVDFLVDTPTDVHILLKQEKPFKTANGGDAMAEDFLAMYLYDESDKRISGTAAATNYREIGLVQHLNAPGRYAVSVTCPRGNGMVPCKVEVVALEKAHVRITEPPENARDLGEVDLSFLDPEPEGVPIADLPLDSDPKFQDDLDALKKLHEKPAGNEDAIKALEKKLNDRAHEIAKDVLGKDRDKYLGDRDLDKLNPVLNSDPDYINAERDRYNLKKDPRNASKVRDVEAGLRDKADELAELAQASDLTFLDPEYLGIPTDDIQVMEDPTFADIAQQRATLMRDPVANARKINDLEDQMHDRARELADDMHNRERTYLDPEPEGVPLDLLPLNEDEPFSKMEDELRALNRKPKKDAKAIKALQDKLNDRAHELAGQLKDDERNLFLDPQPLGVPIAELPLDTDYQFHPMEIERLQLRKDDPIGNADRIKDLEDALNDCARELARQRQNQLRGFLDQEPCGIPLEELGLDYDDDYQRMEDQLRGLMKDPKRNAKKIADLQDDMRDHVNSLARKAAAKDRGFLDPEPEGRLVESLPLDANPQFANLDTKRRKMKNAGGADPNKIADMEDQMNDIAHKIAHELNVEERPDYLEPTFKGIPFEDLPLDPDAQFRADEAQRQVLKRDPKRNNAAIANKENDLNKRAMELAGDALANDRGYLDPEPEGVPLRLVPLDSDPAFGDMEAQRAQLKKDPKRNARPIADLEEKLNDRAHELAKELKEKERAKFLDPTPEGIPYQDLPLDSDQPFHDMEIQRLQLLDDPRGNAAAIQDLDDALNDRAHELAKQKKQDDRSFLDPAPLGVPLEQLPLDDNEEFAAKEKDLRELKKDPRKNANKIKDLEDDLNRLAEQIAADELAKGRGFLDPEPEGRLLEELPLNTDPEFRELENEYRELQKDPRKNAQKLADLEELMNERAHQLAKEMNAKDRPKYLNPAPHGIPLKELPLDDDDEFATLEAQRAKLMRNPTKNAKAIKDLEDALNLRAEELAREKIQEDHAFLDPEPEAVPLKYLPLEDDKAFQKMEADRIALKAKNVPANDPRLRDLEDQMNERAHEIAKAEKEKVRAAVLPARINGVPREALQLDEDMPFNDLEAANIKARGDGDPEREADLADAMRKRASDVAAKLREEERQNLGEPLGFSPSELPLDSNKDYLAKEAEVIALRTDPTRNADKIAAGEDALQQMAMDMAKEKAAQERDFLDPDPEGRRVEDLNLDDDPTFRGLEEQYRKTKKDPYADMDRLADLEQMMNDRAHQVARQMNAAERADYLDEAPRNVAASELPLDTDEEFARLEAQRAKLNQDPRRNAKAVKDTEDALNARAAELAQEALKNDRIFLDDEPEGVPQRQVPIDSDPQFKQLEQQRAALKQAPSPNAAKIREVEDQMNDRLHELAKEVKADGRDDMEPSQLGIPLKDLEQRLDEDPEFLDLEERYRDAKKDPAKQKVAAQLLDQMNKHAKDVAQQMHDEERADLDQNPEGIPISSLPLNEDPTFVALENEARALRNEPNGARKNADKLADLQDKLNARAEELANEQRTSYCDADPEGIPLKALKLGDDPEFVAMENELRRLKKNPVANRGGISDLEDDLNNRAHEKARELLAGDRGYLDPEPEGVPQKYLPLDTDNEFRELEARRAALKAEDPRKNQKAIKDLEDQLNDRAHQLAKDIKANELRALDPDPMGLNYDGVKPHEDDEFAELADQLRDLKAEPRRDNKRIQDVQDKMNARAADLVAEALKGDRGYLDQKPEGVPVNVLPLDEDPQFRRLETERAKLKARDPVRNQKKIQDVEDQLNARAHQLAQEQKKEDLRGLNQAPEGVPLEVLDPHSDPTFASYLPELRALKADPRANKQAIQDLLDKMDDRCEELAKDMLQGDRKYLQPDPEGVPLSMLPLDTDPQFHDMEVQRAALKAKDPRRNANKIKDLEDKLNARAHELAEAQKQKDLENLDPNPEDIPINLVNPHADPAFADMVDKHRALAKDPKRNADALANLEDAMNDRAHQLAKDMMEKDRGYLDPEPQGVPISHLPLSEDPAFHQLEAERAKLKAQDPRRNAPKIKALEQQLNNRAHELAREELDKDLAKLDQAPRGIPIELLKPHDDDTFAALAKAGHTPTANRSRSIDPQADDSRIQAMNDRARQLADDALNRDYLDKDPEGVPLEDLPLDTDPEFHDMEVERAKLKLKDPVRNKKKIQDLEDRLNDRAHELAKEQLAEDLAGCDPAPEGIPLDLLRPHDDPVFASMVPQLRDLKKDPVKNADQIKALEDQMNNRAYELADALLEGDRGYLDPKPAGVPLEYLPLDQDVEFSSMEVERAKLKAQDPRRNARKIQDLENKLNDRAAQLAEEKKKEELALFPKSYEGIDTAALKPHDDPAFAKMVDQLRQMEKAGTANTPEGEKLLRDMDARLEELAKEKTDGDLWFLDKEPEGIPIEEVPVSSDPAFVKMQQERANLKAQDPRKNADKIKGLEDDMNELAHELARDLMAGDFDGVDPNPMGIPLELLNPREDPQIARILPELRRAKQNPREAKKAQDLLDQLKDRVQELAEEALKGDRPRFLEAEPHGVPLEDLPLDTDGIFSGLELERAKLKLQDPVKNARQIEELEDRLNERANELADEVLKADLKNMPQQPRDIPIEHVNPHEDPDFNELAKQVRALKAQDPRRNADKIKDLEDQMEDILNNRVNDMLNNDRGYLDQDPEGVPVSALPLDDDPQFHQMEVERAILKAQDPKKNADKIRDLEEALNDRAHALAEAQKLEDLDGLNDTPLGVPLALLNPHDDATFGSFLPELRRLKEDPVANRGKIADMQADLDDVLNDLAADYLDKDRATYLPTNPGGVPLKALPLDDDPEFKRLEAERLDLIAKNPRANKDAIADLEAALNDRAEELAKEQLRGDRDFLEPDPHDIPLSALPLDTDRQFADLEGRRAALKSKDPVKNAAAIRDLEDQMNDRADQLALDQIEEDLRNLDQFPEDIPVRSLHPHADPEFARMANALRTLKADPRADPNKIAALEADMNDRIHELAEDALHCDRPEYLDPLPEGIPVEQLDLDADPLYHQMEAERAKLKLEDPNRNAAKIKDLEDRLNDRAHELAKEQQARDLADLDNAPRGIPLELLKPHDDETFANIAAQRRDPAVKSRGLGDEDAQKDVLNRRLDEMARDMLEGDRGYLDPYPEGVPLENLPLDEDPEFHDMEVQRAILKAQDPKKNADKIKDLEGLLNDRAHELARDALAADRDYLDPEPEGVPLEDLPLDTDPKFHQLETQRAKLMAQDPKKNADKIKDLEDQLNDRAHDLAKAQLAEDLKDLDPLPRGIPLESLNPHDDPTFASYLPELRKLKKDPVRNAAKIKDLQGKMNNRADELAKDKIDRDRAFLDPTPEGLPLAQLPLDDDPKFRDLEKQLRAANANPAKNADKIADLKDQLNERAHELARDALAGDRGYLDQDPEGVPIGDVPIDSDPKFRELEAQRAALKAKDPSKNAPKIKDLEDQLNDRAHELAKEQKERDRAFLNPTSHDIPKALLPLDDDAAFKKMEQQLRRLNKDPKRNAAAIDNLKDMMQDRADELGEVMLKGDRDNYLDPTPEGVNVADLPLDTDPQYHNMEVERAILKAQDPKKNADKIKDLEDKLNDRAHELAKEQRENERAFLDPEPEGIPIADVPLDDDPNFKRMEDYLRKLNKNPKRNADAIKDTQDKMNDRAHELAKGVVAEDLAALPVDKYRGIPKEDLNLHSYPEFRDAANRRRAARRRGSSPQDVKKIADEMDDIARRIADDVIDNERAFLDPEPEGMDIHDLPLDDDKEFAALEAERRRLQKDPRAAKRNKDVIRDLEDKMNDRAHQMAKDAFAKDRAFLDPEPEGVPLAKLPLDTDPVFKDAEIARYKAKKDPNANPKTIADLEKKMNDRAHDLAKKELDKDRGFLDPEPEGVPLENLPLATDPEFNELAKQRQALKNSSRGRDPGIKDLEEKMNDRAHQLANDYLNKNRDYLDPEPQNVPIADLPLNRDPVFRDMENELMSLKKDPKKNADQIAQLKEDLNARADEIARDQLKKERAMQNQEPLGVPLSELPLNYDKILNPLERQRRALKKDPKKNAEALRQLEPEIEDRVEQIAKDYLDKERDFLDRDPEGVPLDRLPLNDDRAFHDMEKELRQLKKQPAKNKDAIEDLQEKMNDRAHELAKDQLAKDRDFLNPEPLGVPVELLPLNTDPAFKKMEDERRELKKDPRKNADKIKDLEDKLNDRAEELAQDYLDKERAPLDQKPEGILLKDLPLNKDKPFRELEKELRELKKDPRKNAEKIKDVENDMNDRAHELAKRQLADDRNYLNPEPRGVPLAELDLDNDPEFREKELQRRDLKKDPKKNADAIKQAEDDLNRRADELARDYLKKDRDYLDQAPEGLPLEDLEEDLNNDADFHGMEADRRRLNKDPKKNAGAIKDLEDRLNDRAREIAKDKKGYQDEEFHKENEDIAEQWPRIRELYPEGVYDPVTPDTTLPSDVASAPQDMGFLAPFIAALARHPVLISRLFQDKAHPQNQPYRITLFNPDSSPVTVEVDDRVPCDEQREPKFTQVPSRMWYPLLLEKAYAKFVGGYENFNNCNAHDTLRDLTGRPVLHISLEDPKHAAATNMGDYTTPAFWRRVIEDIGRGDIFVCVANNDVPNGFHPQCSYALLDVIEVTPGTTDPNDVIVKIHNCYRDAPMYNGPLRPGDSKWTKDVKAACDYNPDETDAIFVPMPIFLENFSCMQRCHINCSDRLSSPGEWNDYTAGGTSKYTTFRSNPIYLVENKSSRPATILSEVRHAAPLYVDETSCKRYPYTGLTLMQPTNSKMPPTPFITNGTHKFLQKGMMLDSREVCSEMELPPNSVCYLIPYTKDRGTAGNFHVSIYPDMAKVTLTPLRHAGLTLKPLKENLSLDAADDQGTRVDFMVNDSCDVHILLHQNKVSDANAVRRGDAVAENEICMAAFNEYGIRVGSTGDPTNAREHALVFKAPQGGRYSVLITCTAGENPVPATLEIYTPTDIEADMVPVPPDAKPLSMQSNNSRFPTLSRTATAPSRGVSRDGRRGSNVRRTDSLPPVNARGASARRASGSQRLPSMDGSRR